MCRESDLIMKIKTAELTGAALDWAVAKCLANVHEDAMLNGTIMHGWWISGLFTDPNYWIRNDEFNPSTNWTQGGPIIESERITLDYYCNQGESRAALGYASYDNEGEYIEGSDHEQTGPTPLIAAMRCYVSSKLGDEIEVPDALL